MPDRIQLIDSLLHQYGPLIGGADLRKVLGFRSAAAFQHAVREKIINVRIFGIPGRRGKFALTLDVAAWLTTVSNAADAVATSVLDKLHLGATDEDPDGAKEAQM